MQNNNDKATLGGNDKMLVVFNPKITNKQDDCFYVSKFFPDVSDVSNVVKNIYKEQIEKMKETQEYQDTVFHGRNSFCFDVDGVIFANDKHFPEFGEIIPETVDFMRYLKCLGFRIIIHSCRCSGVWSVPLYLQKMILEQKLIEHRVPFDEIWDRTGKPFAIWYFDDQAGFNPDRIEQYKHKINLYLDCKKNNCHPTSNLKKEYRNLSDFLADQFIA